MRANAAVACGADLVVELPLPYAMAVKISYEKDFPTHTEAFKELVKLLSEGENRVVENVGEISRLTGVSLILYYYTKKEKTSGR